MASTPRVDSAASCSALNAACFFAKLHSKALYAHSFMPDEMETHRASRSASAAAMAVRSASAAAAAAFLRYSLASSGSSSICFFFSCVKENKLLQINSPPKSSRLPTFHAKMRSSSSFLRRWSSAVMRPWYSRPWLVTSLSLKPCVLEKSTRSIWLWIKQQDAAIILGCGGGRVRKANVGSKSKQQV